jgi:hypothetical protein
MSDNSGGCFAAIIILAKCTGCGCTIPPDADFALDFDLNFYFIWDFSLNRMGQLNMDNGLDGRTAFTWPDG